MLAADTLELILDALDSLWIRFSATFRSPARPKSSSSDENTKRPAHRLVGFGLGSLKSKNQRRTSGRVRPNSGGRMPAVRLEWFGCGELANRSGGQAPNSAVVNSNFAAQSLNRHSVASQNLKKKEKTCVRPPDCFSTASSGHAVLAFSIGEHSYLPIVRAAVRTSYFEARIKSSAILLAFTESVQTFDSSIEIILLGEMKRGLTENRFASE